MACKICDEWRQGFKEAAERNMRTKILFTVLAILLFSAIAAYGVLSNKDETELLKTESWKF